MIKVEELIGQSLGNYILLELIGAGSVGYVFRAYQRNLNRNVAVKLILKDRILKSMDFSQLNKEAEVLANLHHQNIVSVYDLAEEQDYIYIVMQWILGLDLAKKLHLRKNHPIPSKRGLSLKELINICKQGLAVLEYAGSQGVVHRDLKPQNLLIEKKTGHMYVADFGLASFYYDMENSKNTICGTPLYISPEQARGDNVDIQTDIFSFGCVLAELSIGQLPFSGNTPKAIILERRRGKVFPCSLQALMPHAHQSWCQMLEKAIYPEKDKRFRSATEWLASLEEFLLEIGNERDFNNDYG